MGSKKSSDASRPPSRQSHTISPLEATARIHRCRLNTHAELLDEHARDLSALHKVMLENAARIAHLERETSSRPTATPTAPATASLPSSMESPPASSQPPVSRSRLSVSLSWLRLTFRWRTPGS